MYLAVIPNPFAKAPMRMSQSIVEFDTYVEVSLHMRSPKVSMNDT
jgi:hypothetical protein